MFALIESHKGMDWYFDGSGWSSSPVAFFSNRRAAERAAWRYTSEAKRFNTARTYRVESEADLEARLAG